MKRRLMAMLAAGMLTPASITLAGAHTWDVVEVFSTPDGTIQFIELQEQNGTNGEWHIGGLHVRATPGGGDFTFPANITPDTANKRILLATQAFADLPNAPTPDHIIPANFFNPANGYTFSYHTYDNWVVNAGQIPTDCLNSWNRSGASGVLAAPTPTNYAGQGPSGPIDYCPPPPCPADLTGNGGTPDGQVNVSDLFFLLANWNTSGAGADLAAPTNIVDVADLFALLAAWGDC